MNFLFHLYLSGDDEELLVGNFMGDFVKGPLSHDYPPQVRQGLLLHRQIDVFAQQNVHFQCSRLRIDPEYGHYRGVLVDLFYDHFLAKEWKEWSPADFSDYLRQTHRTIDRYRAIMSPELQSLTPIIFNELLPSYRQIAGTEAALRRMARRIRRPNPLGAGGLELSRHYQELQQDFALFTPAAQNFVSTFRADPPAAPARLTGGPDVVMLT